MYPAKLGVKFLSKGGINLLECEAIIKVVLDNLKEQPYRLAQELHLAIQEKILKRRKNKDAFQSLILYLNDSNSILTETYFKHPSVNVLNNLAVKLMKRLFVTPSNEENEELDEVVVVEQEKNMAQQLAEALSSLSNGKSDKGTVETNYLKEMQLYARTQQRTPMLDRLLDALKTMQATSVASERIFSEANSVVTKTRNKLSDENINCIVFLKGYFNNKDKK